MLKPEVWSWLVTAVRSKGELELAAKLARQARQVCPKLSQLRAAPRLVFPCPVPTAILQQLQRKVRATLMALPFVKRALQFDLMVEGSRCAGRKLLARNRCFHLRSGRGIKLGLASAVGWIQFLDGKDTL